MTIAKNTFVPFSAIVMLSELRKWTMLMVALMAAMISVLSVIAEVSLMVYLWCAVRHNYFGIVEKDEDPVVAHILHYRYI